MTDQEESTEEQETSKLYELGGSIFGILKGLGMESQLKDRVIKELTKSFEKKAKKDRLATTEEIAEIKPEFQKLIKEQFEMNEEQILILAQAARDKYK